MALQCLMWRVSSPGNAMFPSNTAPTRVLIAVRTKHGGMKVPSVNPIASVPTASPSIVSKGTSGIPTESSTGSGLPTVTFITEFSSQASVEAHAAISRIFSSG